jgi:hypothetical protein
MKAKRYAQWVRQQVSKEEERLKELLIQLDTVAADNLQEELSNGECTDKI